ncbi:terminal uridylyltransferase Tailor-like [Pectinophora gossypiella]|uniref:terminal uridylyltransferase Tailor-like n=1 Tax=Pectinophora gossypiella TaxID=13191 RepID=UPI00214ECF04|nr:terminal uridylyltransferase Tailor-like [Pectinophora gossypiella]
MENENTGKSVVLSLPAAEAFSHQVDLLLHRVKMPRHQVDKFADLLADTTRVLREKWPECKLVPFGSVPMGLATIYSDIDYHVYLPDYVTTTPHNRVLTGFKLLKQHPEMFDNVKTILNASVPVITFRHKATKLYSDLIFNDFAGEKETYLVKYILSFDHRLYPVLIIVKFWSKIHKLNTNGMTNFAWILMVTFYFQQANILPPILKLQVPHKKLFIDNWNVAYEKKYEDLYYNGNPDSVYQLLGKFFTYFSKFDFENYVISTFTASSYKKEIFRNLERVPELLELYKFNVKNNITEALSLETLCIPHPLIHNKNACSKILRSHAMKIIKYIQKAARLFREVGENNYLSAILTMSVEN